MRKKRKSSRRIAIVSPLRMMLLQRYLYPKHLHLHLHALSKYLLCFETTPHHLGLCTLNDDRAGVH
uniref:Uncharacterized protein n=1 Tax=Triticum urartu TaxID=4572 RepID=A0A8R7PJX6_TRIUA